MVRHIYDLPYDQVLASGTKFTTIITDLTFHINVFEAADKYDVPSLRVLVVSRFSYLMRQSWQSEIEDFCSAINRLCGPPAVHLADISLQAAAASFCSAHILDLIKMEAFVRMIEEGEPFAGRLLTRVLNGKVDGLFKAYKCIDCRDVSDEVVRDALSRKCINCGSSAMYKHGFHHYKSLLPM